MQHMYSHRYDHYSVDELKDHLDAICSGRHGHGTDAEIKDDIEELLRRLRHKDPDNQPAYKSSAFWGFRVPINTKYNRVSKNEVIGCLANSLDISNVNAPSDTHAGKQRIKLLAMDWTSEGSEFSCKDKGYAGLAFPGYRVLTCYVEARDDKYGGEKAMALLNARTQLHEKIKDIELARQALCADVAKYKDALVELPKKPLEAHVDSDNEDSDEDSDREEAGEQSGEDSDGEGAGAGKQGLCKKQKTCFEDMGKAADTTQNNVDVSTVQLKPPTGVLASTWSPYRCGGFKGDIEPHAAEVLGSVYMCEQTGVSPIDSLLCWSRLPEVKAPAYTYGASMHFSNGKLKLNKASAVVDQDTCMVSKLHDAGLADAYMKLHNDAHELECKIQGDFGSLVGSLLCLKFVGTKTNGEEEEVPLNTPTKRLVLGLLWMQSISVKKRAGDEEEDGEGEEDAGLEDEEEDEEDGAADDSDYSEESGEEEEDEDDDDDDSDASVESDADSDEED